MPHNINLPRHRYVYVDQRWVLRDPDIALGFIPAVWWGVSVTPNRTLACHVVLENGAMVVDLPLQALCWTEIPFDRQDSVASATWDSYGWDAETVSCDYLDEMTVELLNADHQQTGIRGELWFAVDHVRDGFSMEPAQHKHLWVVAVEDGTFAWLPQDQLLLHDKSFTRVAGVPPIKRQEDVIRLEDRIDDE